MRVLVCGSREVNGEAIHMISQRLSSLPLDAVIIHGGARGVDRIAAAWAHANFVGTTLYPADWETHGKKAGILRNLEMLDTGPDLVLAFWDGSSRGTLHTIEEARRRGIPVEVIPLEPEVSDRLLWRVLAPGDLLAALAGDPSPLRLDPHLRIQSPLLPAERLSVGHRPDCVHHSLRGHVVEAGSVPCEWR